MAEHSSDLGSFSLSYLGQTLQMTKRQLLPAGSNLATTWSYLDNIHDRRLSAINNAGLAAGQYTNFAFTTTPENFISGITQSSDATVATPTTLAQTVAYNELNEITQVSGQAYTYDANGNLTSDGDRTYTWDAENRLVGIAYPATPGKQTQFSYDGLGRRIEIDNTPAGGGTATTAKYVWCGDRLCQARDGAYAPSRSYFAEGEFKTSGSNPALFYGVDQIGSVRRVFESAASAPAYDYDSWGVPLQTGTPLSDFGFGGLFGNGQNEIWLAARRTYMHSTGRWSTRDPFGEASDQSGSLYSYVNGNPISYLDQGNRVS